MSYAIEWTSGARRAFSDLPIEVQEVILDELDRLADAGDLLPRRPLPLTIDHDTRVDAAAGAHYVFVRAKYEPPRQILVVIRLGHHLRANPT